MAKPKHGRWNNYASPSSSIPSSATRRFTRTRSPHAVVPRPFPSPALLSALAVIATTPTVVAGGPLPLPTPPPSFLCPFVDLDDADPLDFPPCTPVPSTSTLTPTPTPTPSPNYVQRQAIADRYVEGSDSLWRKTNAWTLYGSTCCSTSTTPIPSGIQLQPASSQTPMPSLANSSVTETFDTSALPAGWDTATTTSSNTDSTIILSLAIVLAGCICVFMIGCLVWRRRKKKARDIERKLGRNHNADNDTQENAREKDSRGKMRIWAKASARWRSNIRQSARRRRKRPLGSSISNRPLSPSFCDSQVSVVAPSRRGSIVPEVPNPSEPEPVSSFGDSLPRPPDVQHDSPRPVSPPTYGASLSPRFLHSPPSSAVSHPSPTPPPDRLAQLSTRSSFIVDDPLPYVPRNDGHVAIDDKAQLARMQQLASSPPIALNAASASTTQPISVPDWHEVEDDLENYGVDLREPFHDFGLPPSFPPPPSKADVSFGYLDGHHHLCYGERDDIPFPLSIPELPATPSGPSPSAPLIDYPGLEPSAPSLEDEDDIFQDWDGTSHVPEAVASADRDSTLSGVTGSPIPPSISPISCAPSPTRGPDATDSILPQYHP